MSWAFDCQGELPFSLLLIWQLKLYQIIVLLFIRTKIFNDKLEKYILEDGVSVAYKHWNKKKNEDNLQ